MDFHKLKLESYASVKFENIPDGTTAPLESAEAIFQYLLSFVQTEAQVDQAISSVVKAGNGTTLVLAYPKGTSKRFESEVNRDSMIARIKKTSGFKAPKLVSLDKDWSGFSFKYTGDSA